MVVNRPTEDVHATLQSDVVLPNELCQICELSHYKSGVELTKIKGLSGFAAQSINLTALKP